MGDAREVVLLLVSWALTTGLSFAAVIVDERRLDADALARAWPPASRDAALIAFGFLAVPLHFLRTRGDLRSARGLLRKALGLGLGLVATAAVVLASSLVTEALAWALGV